MVPVGALLTGGLSSRFGSDKALAVLDPKPSDRSQTATSNTVETKSDHSEHPLTMGKHLVDVLRGAGADPVVAIGGVAGHQLQIPVVADRQPGLGPLSGLASALRWAGRGYVLVIPCDLPLLRSDDLRALIQAVVLHRTEAGKAHPGPERAAIAVIDGRPEPTVGCWPASAGLALQRAVSAGDRRLRRSLEIVPWFGVELRPNALRDADDPRTLRHLLSGLDTTTSPKSPPAT